MRWGRIAVWIAGVALAVGLFPTLRAIVTGDASQPALLVASPTTEGRVSAATLARIAVARAPQGSRRVLLVGNSVAFDLAPGFRQTVSQPPVALFDAAIPACNFPPLVTASYENPATNQRFVLTPCHPTSEVVDVSIFRPAVVFWIANDAPPPWSYRGQNVQACREPYDSLYERSLREEIMRLRARGAMVVVTTEAYTRYVVAGGGLVATALPDETVDCNNRLRRKVADETGVQLVDLFNYTCPRGHCRVKVDGQTLRPDGLHYSGAGGVIAAQWLYDQVRQ